MSLDLSDAIALAKDLLKTSSEFRPHDPDMAAEFASRAFEICDDLGIDRALVGEPSKTYAHAAADVASSSAAASLMPTPEAPTSPTPAELADEDARQTSQQLRDLLQQQARVLETMRETDAGPEPKEKKRGFGLFGRQSGSGFGTLQSA